MKLKTKFSVYITQFEHSMIAYYAKSAHAYKSLL